MNVKYFILFILLIPVNSSYSKEISVYNYSYIEQADTYLFGDNVRVRKDPSVKNDNITDVLDIGDKIKIIGKTDRSMAVDGYREFWYKISYKKNGKESSGYAWGGLFSIAYSVKGEKLFLAGIKKYNPDSGFTGECRLVEKGRIISSLEFSPHYFPDGSKESEYGYSVSAELGTGKGLEGIENTFRIYFNYEACGYPRGNVWIGWGNNRLYYIGKDTSVSEAGVFHAEEKYVFPEDNKKGKSTVILIDENYEFDEALNDYRLKEKKETRYIWKNNKLNQQE